MVTTYFSVNADVRWDVEELTKAIRQERTRLQKIDITDIVLLKLNDPVQIAPASTLAQRVPSPIIDFSVELEEPTDKISDVFPKHLGHNLHIIVKLRRQRYSKKPRLESLELEVSDPNLVMWNLLWNTFWGKQASECFGKGSARIPVARSEDAKNTN